MNHDNMEVWKRFKIPPRDTPAPNTSDPVFTEKHRNIEDILAERARESEDLAKYFDDEGL